MLPFRWKGALLTEATMPAPCQVRRKTESPCPNLAVAEIRGVAFCASRAREQEAYFAIGELLTRGEERGLRGKPLAEALSRVRRGRSGGREGVAAEVHGGTSGAHEAKSLALRNG